MMKLAAYQLYVYVPLSWFDATYDTDTDYRNLVMDAIIFGESSSVGDRFR
jgi:hypothetical protein